MNRRTLLKSSLGAIPALSTMRGAAGEPFRIVVTFAWGFSSIANIVITPGLLRLFQRHLPAHRVTMICDGPSEKHRQYLSTRFPDCTVLPSPFGSAEPRSKEFTRAFDAADMMLFSSGTTLSFGRWDRDWNRTMRCALSLVLARESRKPYGIYGHSFEGIRPPSEILMVPLLSGAKFLFTRETESLAYLKDLGVRSRIMGFAPDAAFAFDLRDETGADEFLRKYRLEPRRFMVLVIRSKVQGFINDRREQLHAEKLRHVVARYVEATGDPVLLCPETSLEAEPMRRLIYNPLAANLKEKVRVKDDFWLPDLALSVFSRARALVSMEMHSAIMALAAGTPALHPRFLEAGVKAWMLRDIGVEDWLFDLDTTAAEQVAGALMGICRDPGAASAKLKAAQQVVARRQTETMAVVRQTLEAARRT